MHRVTISSVVALTVATLSFAQSSAVPTPLAQTAGQRIILVDGSTVQVRIDGRSAFVSRDGGSHWARLMDRETTLGLRYAQFDPVASGEPPVPEALRAPVGSRLWIVQYETQSLPEYRAALERLGAELRYVVPHQGFVVRMDRAAADAARGLPFVRWVGAYHPAYRLEPEILADLASGANESVARPYNVMMVDDRRDRAATLAAIESVGARFEPDSGMGILQVAYLDHAQLASLAADDTVLWIDRLTEVSTDIDQARIQGGANYIESVAGFDGKGVVGMIMEGIYPTHPEFAAQAPYRTTPIAHPSGAAGSSHGNSTAGEIYARGANPLYRGIMPFAQALYCNYNYVYNNNNRKSVTQWGVSNYGQMIETASWGYSQTTAYTTRSAEMDDIIFDLDVATTQSQSNLNSQSSRPQAWAKNIIAIGGFTHANTANPADDSASGASFGPSTDLRMKPDLCAYYDQIGTTGGTATSYTTSFGGTSGATPICNGYTGLTVQLFAEGTFGHPGAPSWQQITAFGPHFTTTKALLAATSYIYPTTKFGTPAQTRNRQGWGFPQVDTMYDQRERMLVADEETVLQQGQQRDYLVFVPPGTADFRASMSYADPEANPAVTITRINSVDLMVRAPNGTIYWGNNGMTALTSSSPTNTTAPGGAANDRDTTENVFLANPASGAYLVSVQAPAVRTDGHVETAELDVDFGLVINGIGGSRNRESILLDLSSSQAGDFTVTTTNLPGSGWTRGFTLFSASTGRIAGNGNLFGLELDGLTEATLSQPIDTVFQFSPTSPGYPAAPYSFPAPIAVALSGVTLDAVVYVVDAVGNPVAVSNVDRVTVQ
ncbi:MAG: hypothetical protein IPM29_02190 [Planctomycetes bacterium]|nr:hypothetical protein [Planctomycetota bacterium]